MIDVMIYLRAECLLFQNATSSQPEFESSLRLGRSENAGAHLTGATGLTFLSTTASAEYETRGRQIRAGAVVAP
jgi:hypothetical protein